MRARVYDGHRGRAVQLPDWVTLHARWEEPDSDEKGLCARCDRCGRTIRFYGPRQDDERALGQFALWHRRCQDRATIRASVRAAEERRPIVSSIFKVVDRRKGR